MRVLWFEQPRQVVHELPRVESSELHAFLDMKLTELAVGLSRNRQAMLWLQDRAMDDGSLLAMVGTALSAIREQERSLSEIRQRLGS